MNTFDETKYKLSTLCKRGHGYKDSGMSLRLLSNRSCVECRIEHYDNNREELLLQKREYYQDNVEDIITRNKEYRRNNTESISIQKKKYYQDNIEKMAEKNKKYRIDNAESLATYQKKYHKDNAVACALRDKIYKQSPVGKEVIRRSGQKRRVLKAGNGGSYTSSEWMDCLDYFNSECCYCGAQWSHVEHILPVSKGGTSFINNLAPACTTCNLRKNNVLLDVWYPTQEFYTDERHNQIVEWMEV